MRDDAIKIFSFENKMQKDVLDEFCKYLYKIYLSNEKPNRDSDVVVFWSSRPLLGLVNEALRHSCRKWRGIKSYAYLTSEYMMFMGYESGTTNFTINFREARKHSVSWLGDDEIVVFTQEEINSRKETIKRVSEKAKGLR